MKKALALLLVCCALMLTACGGSRGGNGVNSCKNCGRGGSISKITGYCDSCDESFWEWQSKQ